MKRRRVIGDPGRRPVNPAFHDTVLGPRTGSPFPPELLKMMRRAADRQRRRDVAARQREFEDARASRPGLREDWRTNKVEGSSRFGEEFQTEVTGKGKIHHYRGGDDVFIPREEESHAHVAPKPKGNIEDSHRVIEDDPYLHFPGREKPRKQKAKPKVNLQDLLVALRSDPRGQQGLDRPDAKLSRQQAGSAGDRRTRQRRYRYSPRPGFYLPHQKRSFS